MALNKGTKPSTATAAGPGDQGLTSDQVIKKTQKMVLDTFTISIIRYRSRVSEVIQGKE